MCWGADLIGTRGTIIEQTVSKALVCGGDTRSRRSVLFVQGRIKSLYSIQRKMRRKAVPLEDVYDARALRVVVDDADGEQQARV